MNKGAKVEIVGGNKNWMSKTPVKVPCVECPTDKETLVLGEWYWSKDGKT